MSYIWRLIVVVAILSIGFIRLCWGGLYASCRKIDAWIDHLFDDLLNYKP